MSCGGDCSTGPSCSVTKLVEAPDLNHVSRLCYKCKASQAEVFTRGLNACLSCFRVLVEGNVRNSLRLKCSVTRGTRVALCMSGGESSIALLHMLIGGQRGSMEKWEKTLGLQVESIVFVDLLQLFDQNSSPLRQFQVSPLILSRSPLDSGTPSSIVAQQIIQLVNSSSVNPDRIPLEILSPLNLAFPSSREEKTSPTAKHYSITSAFEALSVSVLGGKEQKDLWVINDLLEIVRDRSLLMYSMNLNSKMSTQGCRYDELVFLFGQTGTRIATQSFEALCKGAGAKMPLISSYADNRFSKLRTTFVKPMKKLVEEEVNKYIETTVKPHWCPELSHHSTPLPASSSIATPTSKSSADLNFLVNDFLSKLQSNNFQSVSTVIQTLDKLGSVAIDRHPQRTNSISDRADVKQSADGKQSAGVKQLFKFGWCKCCLGPLESEEAKESTCLWSRKQQETLASIDASCVVEGRSIPEYMSKNLCLSCIRVAATLPPSAKIVKLLMEESSAFSSLFLE